MQLTMSSSPPWFASFKRQLTGLLVFVLVVSWASLLTYRTIEIQHSCQPLLYWTEVAQKNCPSLAKVQSADKKLAKNELKASTKESQNKISNGSDKSSTIRKPAKDINKPVKDNSEPKPISNLEKVAVTAGVVAAVGLAVIGAPVILTAMVGTSAVLATCHFLLNR
jgi:hypothetical protein